MSYAQLYRFVEVCRKFQENNNDLLIPVTGPKGCGKSSFSIQVVRIYLKKYFGINYFDPKKWIAYDNLDFINKIHELPEYSPIIADEAARFAMGEDWAKSESKELKKLVAQIRPKKLLIFMCIPRFRWIDSKYRNDMVTFWVRIIKRGLGAIFQPDLSEVYDAWHLDELNKMTGFYSYFPNYERLLKAMNKHVCYNDYIKFPEVDREIYDKYEAIRNAKVFEKTEVAINERDLCKIAIYNLKEKWEELLKLVSEGRLNRPTNEHLAQVLFKHPKTNRPLLHKITIHKYEKSVKDHLGDIVPAVVPDPEAEDSSPGLD